MPAKPKVLMSLMVIVAASWVILLLSAYLIFAVVTPLAPPQGAPYSVELAYAMGKALLALLIMGAWLYSFYLLRDAYARLTALNETPISSASRQTHDANTEA